MNLPREPRIQPVPIMNLRPTQITVGMREVRPKAQSWRDPLGKKVDFLGRHLMPVVWGPKEQYYIIDHHHLALALHREGEKEIATTVVADLRSCRAKAFGLLDNRGWLHPFDADGKRRSYDDVRSGCGLVDDPYRSLAGELRRAGGFAKDTTPFSEFLWADFLRRHIKRPLLERDFNRALALAMKYAKGPQTGYLPGWCGPSERP